MIENRIQKYEGDMNSKICILESKQILRDKKMSLETEKIVLNVIANLLLGHSWLNKNL